MLSRLVNVSLLFLLVLAPARKPSAQLSPEEHAQHHPEAGSESAAAAEGMGGMGGMMEGMGSMMESMHSPPPRELYPSLMELESLPMEAREGVREKAHERMRRGAGRLAAGLERLSAAAPGDDFLEMQSALDEMREGLAEFDSGLAAHRALSEGVSTRSVALQWFQREMNLLQTAPAAEGRGPFGLSWFHFWSMSLLSAFALLMLGMHAIKVRRATKLLEDLIPSTPKQPTPTTLPSTDGLAPTASPSSPAASPRTPTESSSAGRETAVTSVGSPAGRAWTGQLRVALTFDETHDIRTFRLVDPGGGMIPFSFLPGQFATLGVSPAGEPVKRAYTISSSPTRAGFIEITVKREAQGLVSRHLHDAVRPGDMLEVRAPTGAFTFTGSEADSIVLIGGGVGITPLMSVVRYLTDRAWGGQITLLYCCRTSADFAFREELESLQRHHPNLSVVASMTREAGTVWMGPTGRLTRDLILASAPSIADQRVHVCGPPPMMASVTAMLRELGTPESSIHTEAFGPARKPGSVPPADSRNVAAPRDPSTTKSESAAPEPGTATITFAKSQMTASLQEGVSVLDVADQLGVEIDSSCRVGSCGSCRVRLLVGSVDMDCDDGLDPADRAAGYILACQATSRSDVTIDA